MSTPVQPADVCIIGLGYVGLTLATAFADAGLRVAGTERRTEIVEMINSGVSSFYEEGLTEALAHVVADGRLRAVHTSAPLPPARAYVITVGTPLTDGHVQHTDLTQALTAVAAGMPDGALVVLRSTVRIGSTSGLAADILAASGKSYRLAMAPERTVEGKAMAELRSLPQIIGGIDAESADAAAALFGALGVEIVTVDRPEEAEFAKLVSNTWRDLQFAFANELAYVADAAGVDIYQVITAAGHNYDRLTLAFPGPVAGPCLEKDAYILADSAAAVGAQAPLSKMGRSVNEGIVGHVGRTAAALVTTTPARMAILGLAFKGRPATSDTRGSLAGNFAAEFAGLWPHSELVGWDPLVSEADAVDLGLMPITLAEAAGADLVLIQTNHRDFSTPEFTAQLVANLPMGAVVIDLWNQLPELASQRPDIHVKVLGRTQAGIPSTVKGL